MFLSIFYLFKERKSGKTAPFLHTFLRSCKHLHHFLHFIKLFYNYTRAANKKQFLTYYLIAAHPGCTYQDMVKLKSFATNFMKITPEQVQIFLPAPSTYSALMYHTGFDPFTAEKIFVAKNLIAHTL